MLVCMINVLFLHSQYSRIHTLFSSWNEDTKTSSWWVGANSCSCVAIPVNNYTQNNQSASIQIYSSFFTRLYSLIPRPLWGGLACEQAITITTLPFVSSSRGLACSLGVPQMAGAFPPPQLGYTAWPDLTSWTVGNNPFSSAGRSDDRNEQYLHYTDLILTNQTAIFII